jgi:uncharacterized repeat protein (TIGR01451 family)
MRWTIAFATLAVALAVPVPAAAAAQPLAVSVRHAPSHFLPGMVAAYTTITVSNPGKVPVRGPVTVADALPAGFTATAAAGEGWTCTGTTCQRDDALPARSSYPPIRVVVNVAADAPERVVNTVTVAGRSTVDAIPVRDACPYGWTSEQKVFDSGIRNPKRSDGCTLLDLVWNAEPFRGHADFVATVDRTAARFPLTLVQRRQIVIAAARSDVGRKPEIDNSCARRIALTFDDGTSIYRPALLRVLRDKKVHGVFFDNGVRVEANPQWARFQVREGHVELNHTYSHVHMDQLTPEQNREEVQRNERVLAAAGAPIAFKGIRPPFGGSNPAVQKQLIELGYTYFLNRISTEDWLPERTAAQVADAIVAQLRPGVIIGMHDGPIDTPAGAATVEATAMIIDRARELGYCFGVVDNSGQVIGDRYVSTGEEIPPVTAPVPYILPLAFGTVDQLPQPWRPIGQS